MQPQSLQWHTLIHTQTHTHPVTYCPTRGRLRCLQCLSHWRAECDSVLVCSCVRVCACVCLHFHLFPPCSNGMGWLWLQGVTNIYHALTHTNIVFITIATWICYAGVAMTTVWCTVLPWHEWDVMFYLLTGILLFCHQSFLHSRLSPRHFIFSKVKEKITYVSPKLNNVGAAVCYISGVCDAWMRLFSIWPCWWAVCAAARAGKST